MAQIRDKLGFGPINVSVFNAHLPHNYPQFTNLLSSNPYLDTFIKSQETNTLINNRRMRDSFLSQF